MRHYHQKNETSISDQGKKGAAKQKINILYIIIEDKVPYGDYSKTKKEQKKSQQRFA